MGKQAAQDSERESFSKELMRKSTEKAVDAPFDYLRETTKKCRERADAAEKLGFNYEQSFQTCMDEKQ
jgi:hypothetical protein